MATARTETGDHIAIQAYPLEDDGLVPNNPLLPLVVMQNVFSAPPRDLDAALIQLFARNGWFNAWVNGIYPYHHYHATSHEVLGIARGQAKVQFGGASGPVLDVAANQVVVIPAGVGHCRLSSSDDLSVVGAYPGGCDWDLKRATPKARLLALSEIAKVPLPKSCPVGGCDGPLLRYWTASAR
jgi:uncharacterized protein YjlB